MSDSKWVKLLKALSAVEGLVKIAKVKLVWDDEIRDINIDDTVKYNFDIYDHTMDSLIQGYPTGLYEFIEIEWLEFPAESQDISFIETVISSTGDYKIEVTDKYLRIYCYKEEDRRKRELLYAELCLKHKKE